MGENEIIEFKDKKANMVEEKEVREITYEDYYQKFSQKVTCDEDIWLSGGSYKVKGFDARVIFSDRFTIVIFDDGSKGMSECMEGDVFSRSKGLKIAFNRAMIQRLEKETRKLVRE